VDDVRNVIIGMFEERPVYLKDIADINIGPDIPNKYTWFGKGIGDPTFTQFETNPSVTIAIAKQKGSNAVSVADNLLIELEKLKGYVIPDNIHIDVTRNYGKTADDKSNQLLIELLSATVLVMLLVFITMGLRAGFVVGVAVIVTLALTVLGNLLWGLTLNRVSLFALILSIGILVDDAIVVVENIYRHHRLNPHKPLSEIIPVAVKEIGVPTIVATLAIVFALVPMAFVTGLMGPYMQPIPINASTGMLISLVVAFTATPWLYKVIMRNVSFSAVEEKAVGTVFFNRLLSPFFNSRSKVFYRLSLFSVTILSVFLAMSLVYSKHVILKMLPSDNKSEFQVLIDMPEGSSLEKTSRVVMELSEYLSVVPEVLAYQAYVGTNSPVTFNGLVRQYDERRSAYVGDINVNLTPKSGRSRSSHQLVLDIRHDLHRIGGSLGAVIRLIETPAGPPVQSPITAEIYGPDLDKQEALGRIVSDIFRQSEDITDVDSCLVDEDAYRYKFTVDSEKSHRYKTAEYAIVEMLATAIDGRAITYLHNEHSKYAMPVKIELSQADKADFNVLKSMRLRGVFDDTVPLGDLIKITKEPIEHSIYRKDMQRYVYIFGDASARYDSPLYGMYDAYQAVEKLSFQGKPVDQYLIQAPDKIDQYAIKWDGEWQVTYETFRDMGLSYIAGLILIYVLLVIQFNCYITPLIVMAPILFTLVGALPGHAILGESFTATSMIGLIALAGIIVRNSILLIDFINIDYRARGNIYNACVTAVTTRFRPVMLTAVSAMFGAAFILHDPIFNGMAISMISGLIIGTLLTLVIIPITYGWLLEKGVVKSN
jgi:multidrug efflux pump subunit AcrB